MLWLLLDATLICERSAAVQRFIGDKLRKRISPAWTAPPPAQALA